MSVAAIRRLPVFISATVGTTGTSSYIFGIVSARSIKSIKSIIGIFSVGRATDARRLTIALSAAVVYVRVRRTGAGGDVCIGVARMGVIGVCMMLLAT
jgi:hypothetical protein